MLASKWCTPFQYARHSNEYFLVSLSFSLNLSFFYNSSLLQFSHRLFLYFFTRLHFNIFVLLVKYVIALILFDKLVNTDNYYYKYLILIIMFIFIFP